MRPLPHHLRPLRVTSLLGRQTTHNVGHRQALATGIGSKRCFHVQPIIGALIQGTQDLILNVHAVTHTPWYLTISLVAVGVNILFRFPFAVQHRQVIRRRNEHVLLIQAWNAKILKEVMGDERLALQERRSLVASRLNKKVRSLYRKLGLQSWKLYTSLLGFPFWLVVIDAIRRLCGAPRGLLGSFVSDARNIVDEKTSSSVPALSGETHGIAEAYGPGIVDPSLTTEGCLWFTDLTASDPYHLLPLALSAMLVLNLVPASNKRRREIFGVGSGPSATQEGTPQPQVEIHREGLVGAFKERSRVGFLRTLLVVAAAIGPITMDLPAAVHLYWLTTSGAYWGSSKYLERFIPVKTVLDERCKGTEVFHMRSKRRDTQGQAPRNRKTRVESSR